MKRYFIYRYMMLAVFLFLIGCMNNVVHVGYARSMIHLWNNIKVGDGQESVLKLLGSPTIFSVADNNIWYYVSNTMYSQKFSFRKKYSTNSLKITFSPETKKVSNISHIVTNPKRLINVSRVESKIGEINDHPLRQTISFFSRKFRH